MQWHFSGSTNLDAEPSLQKDIEGDFSCESIVSTSLTLLALVGPGRGDCTSSCVPFKNHEIHQKSIFGQLEYLVDKKSYIHNSSEFYMDSCHKIIIIIQ